MTAWDLWVDYHRTDGAGLTHTNSPHVAPGITPPGGLAAFDGLGGPRLAGRVVWCRLVQGAGEFGEPFEDGLGGLEVAEAVAEQSPGPQRGDRVDAIGEIGRSDVGPFLLGLGRRGRRCRVGEQLLPPVVQVLGDADDRLEEDDWVASRQGGVGGVEGGG